MIRERRKSDLSRINTYIHKRKIFGVVRVTGDR
jgi:hypothetical protein